MTMSISTRALTGAIEAPGCVVVDVREIAAFNGWILHDEVRGGHLRGAVAFPLEWTAVVQDAALEAQLLGKGVRYDTTVVLYGRDTTAAARAAVLLMYAGVDDVCVLDGGFVAWSRAGYPISTIAPRPEPVTDLGKTLPGHPEYLMATEDVKTLVAERDAALVSVRSWAESGGYLSGDAATSAMSGVHT